MLKNNMIIICVFSLVIGCNQNENHGNFNKLNSRKNKKEKMTGKKELIDTSNQKEFDNESIIESKEYMEFKVNEYMQKIDKAKIKLKGKWQLVEVKSQDTLIKYEDSDIIIEFIDNSKVILNKTISCTYDFPLGGVLELNECNYVNTWWDKSLILSSVSKKILYFQERDMKNSKGFNISKMKFKKYTE